MAASDGMNLAAGLSVEAKEYWVHLDAEGPLEKYPAKQHARRVQEKLGVDEGLIYLAGQPSKNNEDSDMPAPFRQRRYFYYLTGCNEPSSHMTYDIQHDTLSLFIPRIDPRRVIWNGRGSTLAEAIERYDIDEVYYVDELGDVIKDWSTYYGGHGSDIYVLHNGQLPKIPGLHAIIDSDSLQPAMNAARMIKDDHEIQLIRKANNISSEAHKKVLENIVKFKNEAQVEGLFMDVCISRQAKQQAYDPIAASGPNAGTLHYDANNENFGDRQLMCLDAGCEFELYASDITRTFPLSGSWPSEEARNIYKLVETMQESCIERLAPGVRYLDLHIIAHQIAIDGLLKLGILHNGTREEIYAAGTSKAFFPHGLGHHVGLEVHDVGQAELMSLKHGTDIVAQTPSLFPQNFHIPVFDPALCYAPTDAQSSQLQEGMVVTVEPGIYFSIYALQHFYLPSPVHSRFINEKVLQRYMPVGGVRIEDDILITSRGYESLTTAPKGNDMLDIIRGNSVGSRHTHRQSERSLSSANDSLLRRAPGCPFRATPSQLQTIRRATTMPNPVFSDQRSGSGSRDHALNLRGSMTTDELIQHWRQSSPRSPPRTSPAQTDLPATLCGSLSRDVKHIFMGDNHVSSRPESGVDDCAECAILVQTLGRLRQNLALSKQTSSKPVAEALNMPLGPVCNFSVQRRKDTAPTGLDVTVVQAVPAGLCQQISTQGAADCSQPSAQPELCQRAGMNVVTPSMPPPPTTQLAGPHRRIGIKHDTVDHEIDHYAEPEQYYRRPAQRGQQDTDVDASRRHPSSRIADVHPSDSSRYPTLKSQTSMPFRSRASWQQEQRRPSNHTDDRDWMA